MSDATCLIDGCPSPPCNKRGWCLMHYRRWLRHGDPGSAERQRSASGVQLAYFLERVGTPAAHDDWPFPLTDDGYAKIYIAGRKTTTYVLACEMAHGPRPAGLHATHSCLNHHCYWAEHLSWETPSKNEGADKWRDGKLVQATLTPDQVRAIRVDPRLQREIAAEYGVKHQAISNIKLGKTWAWLL